MMASMKKVLFVSHTCNFIKFNLPFLKWFRENGYEVHYACAEEEPFPEDSCDKHFKICFMRSPYSKANFQAYKELKQLINKEQYDIIHCHTPVGGVIARLAAKESRKHGTKVIYTAHGFHFYKGASMINWLFYYPVEKYLANFTDCIVTINEEDYQLAQRKRFKAVEIIKIDGVGVDLSRFCNDCQDKTAIRQEFGLSSTDYVVLCVGELNKNKNQPFLINQIRELKKSIPQIKLLFAGSGPLENFYLEMIKQDSDYIQFLGYRKDMERIYAISDVLISASQREGLPINILEGMASGLPIICTDIRGNRDIVKNNVNGFLYPYNDQKVFQKSFLLLYSNKDMQKKIKESNQSDVKKYSVSTAISNMSTIYKKYMQKRK